MQNGVVLCHLFNRMFPESIKVVHPANSKAWKHRENIGNFLTACQQVAGMKKEELFSISDVFEKKNMPKVLAALQSLAFSAEKMGFKVLWPSSDQPSEFSPQ